MLVGVCCAAIRFAAGGTIRFQKVFGGVSRLQVSDVILSEEPSDYAFHLQRVAPVRIRTKYRIQ